jgi:hypothetical protein
MTKWQALDRVIAKSPRFVRRINRRIQMRSMRRWLGELDQRIQELGGE